MEYLATKKFEKQSVFVFTSFVYVEKYTINKILKVFRHEVAIEAKAGDQNQISHLRENHHQFIKSFFKHFKHQHLLDPTD